MHLYSERQRRMRQIHGSTVDSGGQPVNSDSPPPFTMHSLTDPVCHEMSNHYCFTKVGSKGENGMKYNSKLNDLIYRIWYCPCLSRNSCYDRSVKSANMSTSKPWIYRYISLTYNRMVMNRPTSSISSRAFPHIQDPTIWL